MAFRAPLTRLTVRSTRAVVSQSAPITQRLYSQAASVPTSNIGTEPTRGDYQVRSPSLLSE
jgi:acetylornithine aminotransferase